MNLYGLIGYPLGHSFSKKYFTGKFESEGLEDCYFELYPLEHIGLFTALMEDHPALKGLAVTIPYKQTVIPFLQSLTHAAAEIGAVNCIQFTEQGMKGHNTDVVGFETSFLPLLQPHHRKALVLGTGGASKAVQYVLTKLGIGYRLVSRNKAPGLITYDAIDARLMKEHTVVINCTPLGMTPDISNAPDLPYGYLTPQHYCYDLIYTPAETLFMERSRMKGAATKNGYDMLVIQAETNWTIWNDDKDELPEAYAR